MPKLPKWKERAHLVISTDDTERASLPLDEPPDTDVETTEKVICLFCKKPINDPKPFQVTCDDHHG